ncbi:Retrovirus-related Pol polyprotein from transposon TNT 1-94 [Vitis vinifera]|uniref:Retrovirus-related Pol polyprotein from transposon TNT 1-94 n=1 Tax=Vitis vinifera TaxID=29760 RepID=A0A438K0S8_VITVI|nr:Retrovirus-related Pol polyprotein from transposon TNT 1-94 [Vitis vinifera]
MLQTAWLPRLVHELQAKRRRDGNGNDGGASKNAANGTGKAAIASAESQLSLILTTTVDLDTDLAFKCETCILAKSHRVSYPLSFNKSQMPFELIHSDVWGPSPKSTISGVRWFVIFVDDCTYMTWLYLMKNKDKVFSIFCSFHEMVKTQYSATIHILRSDNGGEYMHRDFKNYFSRHGLIHETTCPQTPQQNEIAERKNRHILETTRAILLGAHVPNHFWIDDVTTAVHLINRMPSKVLKFKTPLQALSTVISLPTALCFRLEYLAVLPSFIYTRISALNSIPAQSSVFFWEPDVDTELGVLPLVTEEQQPQQSIVPLHPTISKDPSPDNIPEASSLNTLSTPVLTNDAHVGYELPYRHNRGKPPDRYSPTIEDLRLKYPIANYVSTKTLPEPLKTFADALSSCQVHTSVEEAMNDPRLVQAMKEEMEALLKNKTWILVSLPKGQKTVGCKWVFSIKYKVDGTVERYKARLVAKGFTQTYEVDY